MKKVTFFFATSGHSGVDKVMRVLVPTIAELGYEVDLLQIKGHGPYFLEEELQGVNRIEFPTSHVYSSIFHLVRYLKQSKPDAMLSDKDRVNRTVILASWLSGSKTSLNVRIGTEPSSMLLNRDKLQQWVQTFSFCKLYKRANQVLVPSLSNKNDFTQNFGLDTKQVSVVASPVLNKSFYERKNAPLEHPWFRDGELPVILGVGELSLRKDFASMIRAFAIAREQIPCRLVILGRGKQLEPLQQLARDLKVSEYVEFTGFVDNPLKYLNHAAVFCLCSHLEGMPVSLIEALGCGCTSVATDGAGGSKELLNNNGVGHVVKVGDEKSIADGLLKALRHPDPVEALRLAAEPYDAVASARAYLKAMGL